MQMRTRKLGAQLEHLRCVDPSASPSGLKAFPVRIVGELRIPLFLVPCPIGMVVVELVTLTPRDVVVAHRRQARVEVRAVVLQPKRPRVALMTDVGVPASAATQEYSRVWLLGLSGGGAAGL